MGTDLYPIGNHKIAFKERPFNEIAKEIIDKLNRTTLLNATFLRAYSLYEHRSYPREVRKIKTKCNWNYFEENEYYNFEEDKYIECEGPYNLCIYFYDNKILFFQPSMRYTHWFNTENHLLRDEWRKYLCQITNLFDGDRVIYLADNGHFLDKYIDYEGAFDDIERALLKSNGMPTSCFKEVVESEYEKYLIDDFSSIDWSKNEPLDRYFPEPDDKSSIDFDMEFYSVKDNIKYLRYDNDLLYHKIINRKIHFIHLLRLEGLLIRHSGIVDKEERLELSLDEYAPFTYDNIEKKLLEEGYGNQCLIQYIFILKDNDHFIFNWNATFEVLKTEFRWIGLGFVGGGKQYENELIQYFYSVNEKIAIETILEIAAMHHAFGNFKIYRKLDLENEFDITDKDKIIFEHK